mgnify:CR=1 FL=1
MALIKETYIGSRNILADGHIEVRFDTVIKDGTEIISGPTFSREVISPGQDVSAHHVSIQRIAAIEHTKAVIDAYINLKP